MLQVCHPVATREDDLPIPCDGNRNPNHRTRQQFLRERIDTVTKLCIARHLRLCRYAASKHDDGNNESSHAFGSPQATYQRSVRTFLSICISSTGAPFTSMNAIITPVLGLFGWMITLLPISAASRSSTSNATCGILLTISG